MLVLSRKTGESIVIPDCDLVVTVVAVNGSRVKLGLEAPRQIDIKRGELYERSLALRDVVATDSASPQLPR